VPSSNIHQNGDPAFLNRPTGDHSTAPVNRGFSYRTRPDTKDVNRSKSQVLTHLKLRRRVPTFPKRSDYNFGTGANALASIGLTGAVTAQDYGEDHG
jgi:hypothetical protein